MLAERLTRLAPIWTFIEEYRRQSPDDRPPYREIAQRFVN
jgi:hypothetical protein